MNEETVRYSGTRVCLKLLQLLDRSIEYHTSILSSLRYRRSGTGDGKNEGNSTNVKSNGSNDNNENNGGKKIRTVTPTLCVDLCINIVNALVHLFPPSNNYKDSMLLSSLPSASSSLSPSSSSSSSLSLVSHLSWLHTPTVLVTHIVWVSAALLRPTIPRLYRAGLRAIASYFNHFDVMSDIHADVLLSTQSSFFSMNNETQNKDKNLLSERRHEWWSDRHLFPGLLRLSSYGIGRPSTSVHARLIACQCLSAVSSLNDFVHPTMMPLRKKLMYVLCSVTPWLSMSTLWKTTKCNEDKCDNDGCSNNGCSKDGCKQSKGEHLSRMLCDLISACRTVHCPTIETLLSERLSIHTEEKQRFTEELRLLKKNGNDNSHSTDHSTHHNNDLNNEFNNGCNSSTITSHMKSELFTALNKDGVRLVLKQKLTFWSHRLSIDIVASLLKLISDNTSEGKEGEEEFMEYVIYCTEMICQNVIGYGIDSNAEKKNSMEKSDVQKIDVQNKIQNNMHVWCCGLELLNQILTSSFVTTSTAWSSMSSNSIKQKKINGITTSILRFIERTKVITPSPCFQQMQMGRKHAWNILQILNSCV